MKDEPSQLDMTYLAAIFDRSADGLMICDANGKILKLNRAAEILNGVKASEVIGKDVRTLVKEGQIDRSATQEVLKQTPGQCDSDDAPVKIHLTGYRHPDF